MSGQREDRDRDNDRLDIELDPSDVLNQYFEQIENIKIQILMKNLMSIYIYRTLKSQQMQIKNKLKTINKLNIYQQNICHEKMT